MDDFEIIATIGKGASGKVYLAKSQSLKKIVAVKKIEIDESKRSRTKKAVTREASILHRIKHPYIVACHKWFLQDEIYMNIVLDYCNGGTLHDRIQTMIRKKQFFTESKILLWMAKVTSAVAYLHEKRILHRDLKAENVFLTKGDNPKLGDFGISKEINHTLDQAQTCVGTPCYLSPELCQDIPYNAKSDVWALGCLLFEITALTPAFDAANLISLFYKIIKCNYADMPSHTPKSIKDLISIILQADPDKRPSAAQLLCHQSFVDCIDEVINVLREAGIKLPHGLPNNQMNFSNATKSMNESKNLPQLTKQNSRFVEFSNRDTQDTITGSDSCVTPTNIVPKLSSSVEPSFPPRSNSVFETPRKPKVFASLNLNHGEVVDDVDRPRTCPHSAVSRYEDDFDRLDSGRAYSSSSADEYSSDNDFDGLNTSRTYASQDFSDKSSSDEEIVEDLSAEASQPHNEDMPELVLEANSSGDFSVDDVKVLPGSAWLRNKRAHMLAAKQDAPKSKVNTAISKKYQLPGSSWLSKNDSTETRTLGKSDEDSRDDSVDESDVKLVRDLPGSAWLTGSKTTQEMLGKQQNGKRSKPPLKKESSMYVESASGSSIGSKSNTSQQQEYEYADDFEDYEDDFETFEESDDEDEGSRPPLAKASSIEVVRRSCKDMVGSSTYNEVCALLRNGASLEQVTNKFKNKMDRETLETLSMLHS